MPKVTQHQLDTKTASIIDVYQHLESQIFSDFVKRLKTHGIEDYDQTTVLQWQMEVMNDLKLVNDSVIDDVAKATGIARQQLIDLFQTAGYQVVDQEYNRASKATKRPVKSEQINMTHQVLDGYLDQTFLQLDNNVNQTLLTTNYNESPAMRTYQQIVKETTADVLAGLKTPDKALKDTIYKWRDKGINLNLIDKGGHAWSLESYARMVINTTTNRAFQAVRDQAASDNGIDTFVMSSHAASRPACAPIQGHLVTTRRQSFTAPESGEFFESLYNHGYGEPGGTFGINCHHMKWLYVPGVSTNNQPQYDPHEAVAKGDTVQKQRELERRIRGYKHELDMANQLNDEPGQLKYKQLIHRNQAALRKLVKDHDFLHRDYSREREYTGNSKEEVAAEASRRVADNDARTKNTIERSTMPNVSTPQQKHAAMDAYENFKKDGVLLSDHAVEQFQNRSRHEKSGKIIFNYQSVLNAAKQPANYVDRSAPMKPKYIKLYGRVAVITEKDGKVVSVYHVNKPRNKWKPIKNS